MLKRPAKTNLLRETARLLYYEDVKDEKQLVIKVKPSELLLGERYLCNNCFAEDQLFYICPGFKNVILCSDCIKAYRSNCPWKQEEMHETFNNLILVVTKGHPATHKLSFTDTDYLIINDYLNAHSNRKLDIHKFMEAL